MVKNKIKGYVIIGLILTSLWTPFAAKRVSKALANQVEENSYTQSIGINKDTKLKIKENIVDTINEAQTINILDVNLTKTAKLTKGDFFKKTQKIKFRLNAKYSIDLKDINMESTIIEGDEITLYLKPIDVEVSFLENATEFGSVDKAWYTLGNEINLSIEELEQVKATLKEEVYKECIVSEVMDIAKNKATYSIESMIEKVTSQRYKIKLVFIG